MTGDSQALHYITTHGCCCCAVVSNCVPMQVFRSFTIRKALPTLYSKYCAIPDVRLGSLLDRLRCSGIYVRQKSVIVDNVHLYGCHVIRTLILRESLAISRFTGFGPKEVSYRVYQRVYCSSFYLTASDYKTSNRHCDDTVQLTGGRFCIILCCVIGRLLCRCSDTCYCTDNALLLLIIRSYNFILVMLYNFNYIFSSPTSNLNGTV